MFTGLIEAVCTMHSTTRRPTGALLEANLGSLASQVVPGESIAVNGCCLTVCNIKTPLVSFELSPETLAKTTFSHLKPLALLNIERAMPANGRLGGHIVQGHVDGIGKIAAIERKGDFAILRFAAQKELMDEIVVKGSVAVDGISLTVASADERGFSVALIPVTLANTNLRKASVGDTVNIETDIIGKMVRKQLAKMAGHKGALTMDKLAEYGF